MSQYPRLLLNECNDYLSLSLRKTIIAYRNNYLENEYVKFLFVGVLLCKYKMNNVYHTIDCLFLTCINNLLQFRLSV